MSGMTRYGWHWCGRVVGFGSGLVVGGELANLAAIAPFASSGNYALAQIVGDRTLPNNSRVSSQNNIRTIFGGTQAGSNLFHSFEVFSVPTGSTAYFNNALDIQNILTRVTGSSVSNIDGLIRANGTANLFFLNPNGIIFGSNARLDIGGSFIASTASSLVFADGTIFSTTPATPTTSLLTISVPLGLQFGQNPGGIRVEGAGNNLSLDSRTAAIQGRDNRPVGLKVLEGKTLALVGGDVALVGGNLTAPGGRIELGSLQEPALVTLNPTNSGFVLSYGSVQNFQDISLVQAASADVSGNGGGSISVQGRRVFLSDGSVLIADTLGSQVGGSLTVNASQAVELTGTDTNGQLPSGLYASTYGTGDGTEVTINTPLLLAQGGAAVYVNTYGSGKGGNLTVNASQEMQLTGADVHRQFFSGLYTQAFETGNAGSLTISTPTLRMLDGAVVSSGTFGFGNGGNLTVNASSLLVRDGAQISTGTYDFGNAGNLTVNVSQAIELIGTSTPEFFLSGLFSQTEKGSTGNAGSLTINTSSLLVRDGAQISAGTSGSGDGQNLTVNASQSVALIGTSASGTPGGVFPSGLFVNSDIDATGDGAPGISGSLTINTPTLLVQDRALVFSGTLGFGNGGNLTVNVSSLLVRNGGALGAKTASSGNGGNLIVNASKEVQLIGTAVNGQASQLYADADETGNAGSVIISTPSLLVRDRATVNISSTGSGRAGNLEVSAQVIRLDNQASIRGDTTGGQGNINLQTGDLIIRRGSRITTNARGSNVTGGNITIDTDNLVAVPKENSDISANAEGSFGGRVIVNASGIFGTQFRDAPTPLSDITATSELGPQFNGTVELNTPGIDPNRGLINLPITPVDTQVSQVCQVGARQNQNSFIITGRGGLPPNPRQVLRSQAVQVDWVTLDAGANNPTGDAQSRGRQRQVSGEPELQISNNVNTKTPEIVEAQGWVVDANGKITLVATAPTVTPHSSWQIPANCRPVESTKQSNLLLERAH